MLEQLKKMGVYDETLVIYMGDNGFMWGEHGLIDKRVSYEASIRVPMMMQCPDLYEGGKVVEQVIGNIDVGPTVLHAAGLQTPDYMDGESFLDLPNKPDMKLARLFPVRLLLGKELSAVAHPVCTPRRPVQVHHLLRAVGRRRALRLDRPTRARRRT